MFTGHQYVQALTSVVVVVSGGGLSVEDGGLSLLVSVGDGSSVVDGGGVSVVVGAGSSVVDEGDGSGDVGSSTDGGGSTVEDDMWKKEEGG